MEREIVSLPVTTSLTLQRSEYAKDFEDMARRMGVNLGVISHGDYRSVPYKNCIYFFCSFQVFPSQKVTDTVSLTPVYVVSPGVIDTRAITKRVLETEINIISIKGKVASRPEGYSMDREFGFYVPQINAYFFRDLTHRRVVELWKDILEVVKSLSGKRCKLPPKPLTKKDKTIFSIPINGYIQLGLDPEFELLRNGYIIHASAYTNFTAHVGLDGSGDQVELRPDPASSARCLVKNIKASIQEALSCIPNGCSLGIAGNRYPLGAHIHVSGVPEQNLNTFIHLMDVTFGALILPMSGTARRDYKRLGAYRTGKSHGGFEYRTPPSGFLYHPDMAYLIFKLVLNLARRWVSGKKIIYYTPQSADDIVSASLKTVVENDLLSEAEWNRLYNHITQYPEEDTFDAWLSNWGIRQRRHKTKVQIHFSQGTELSQGVREDLTAMGSTRGIDHPIEVTFYGLRASRGDVIGCAPFAQSLTCLRANIVDALTFNPPINASLAIPSVGSITIGLPYSWRTQQELTPSQKVIIRRIIRILSKHITL